MTVQGDETGPSEKDSLVLQEEEEVFSECCFLVGEAYSSRAEGLRGLEREEESKLGLFLGEEFKGLDRVVWRKAEGRVSVEEERVLDVYLWGGVRICRRMLFNIMIRL
ncbi:hypothetical protein COLO4_05843 [Corchorus olitorius]|uniref:Uncharacterized protein n=1 Tax=Corchorus olitorius TaxID=93759 RepID=A0A1R3KPQ1_9ROSI|nr:hypothetical protein COLO4_05843 [Corchorus olitorius]